MRHSALAAIALAALLGAPAPAAAQDLRLGTRLSLPTMDPHFFATFATASSHQAIWDRLTDLGPDGRVVPALAESWRVVDANTWEFRLRQGVTYHDGSLFTADDVIWTFKRVPAVPRSPASYGRYIAGVTAEKIDTYTIRLRTSGPLPLLPYDLPYVFIASHRTPEGVATADFDEGRHINGTGPFRFVRWSKGERLEMEGNPAFWGGRPAWARVTERAIPRDAARIAALLAGDVDAIDAVPTAELATLRANPAVSVTSVRSTTTLVVALDTARETSPFVTARDGSALPRNPLRDRRVREALSLAINRAAIAERIMAGGASPAGQLSAPGLDGSHPGIQPPAFDPARAATLLREAGWPDGFRLTIHTDAQSFLNEAAVAQAVAQFWSRIGLAVDVVAVPTPVYVSAAGRQEYSVVVGAQGGITASVPLRSMIATFDTARQRGSSNRTRYSNPAFDALLDQALAEMDAARRQGLYERLNAIVAEEVPVIPIFHANNSAAGRRGFQVALWPDRRFTARQIRPE